MIPCLLAWCSCRKDGRDCISACRSQRRVLHVRVALVAYFLCLHGPHDKGTRFLLRTTLNCGSGGDCPALDDVVEGGVGGILRLIGPLHTLVCYVSLLEPWSRDT
jgi:hypothetical protein